MSRRKNQPGVDREVTVDATLEADLGATEEAIDAYLADLSDARRAALVGALQLLDQQIELSDDYESRIAGSAAFGYASKGSVIGETSSASAAEVVPEAELVAQTVLIKAAKDDVRAPTPETLAGLRAARAALAAARGGEPPAP